MIENTDGAHKGWMTFQVKRRDGASQATQTVNTAMKAALPRGWELETLGGSATDDGSIA